MKVDFGQVIGDMLGDLMASTQPIEIKIFGDDQEVLKKIAKQTAEIVEDVKGTADVFNGITIAGPEILIEPNIAKLAQYNISPSDFQFEMQNKMDGNVVGNIIEQNRLTSIRTLETDKKNLSVNELKNSQILLPNGRLKPVAEFAGISLIPGVAEINRENLKVMIAVTARLNNRDLGSTLKEIQEKMKSLSLPAGCSIEYGGAYKEQQDAFKELLSILIMASFLVFVVILFLFRKIKVALLIMILSVMGIAGCCLALLITNTPVKCGKLYWNNYDSWNNRGKFNFHISSI